MPPLLLSGDQVVFEPSFGAATAIGSLMFQIKGTAAPLVGGRQAVVAADFDAVAVPVGYVTTTFSVPGQAMIEIDAESVPCTRAVTADEQRLVQAEPDEIRARLRIVVPATTPPPASTPDSVASDYQGKGRLVAIGWAPTAD